MSNAIAQDPKLNRSPWRKLENEIRKQKAVQVTTGAIYNNCGNEKIEAPCYIYKLAYLQDGQVFLHIAQNAETRPR